MLILGAVAALAVGFLSTQKSFWTRTYCLRCGHLKDVSGTRWIVGQVQEVRFTNFAHERYFRDTTPCRHAWAPAHHVLTTRGERNAPLQSHASTVANTLDSPDDIFSGLVEHDPSFAKRVFRFVVAPDNYYYPRHLSGLFNKKTSKVSQRAVWDAFVHHYRCRSFNGGVACSVWGQDIFQSVDGSSKRLWMDWSRWYPGVLAPPSVFGVKSFPTTSDPVAKQWLQAVFAKMVAGRKAPQVSRIVSKFSKVTQGESPLTADEIVVYPTGVRLHYQSAALNSTLSYVESHLIRFHSGKTETLGPEWNQLFEESKRMPSHAFVLFQAFSPQAGLARLGVENVEGRPLERVLILIDRRLVMELLIDTANANWVASKQWTLTSEGMDLVTTFYHDWHRVDGVLVPFRQELERAGKPHALVQITSVTWNPPVTAPQLAAAPEQSAVTTRK